MPSMGEIFIFSGVDVATDVGESGISAGVEVGVSSTSIVGIEVGVGAASGVD